MDKSRPPIVVVVGHVDHGKTTLLDAVRKTNIAGREAGGITQGIGASVITSKEGKTITFVDTPGHALFGGMRARGVSLADVALLVVSAIDGVAPQTKEALSLIREGQIPFIVVITKTDLPTANSDSVLGELEKEGVYFEKRGGDIPFVSVSAKTGQGIDELLELISLISEVSGVKSEEKDELSAFVIETSKDKRGLLTSVVVKKGTLKIGDKVYAGQRQSKIKGLFDDKGKAVKVILPGEPGQILGFEDLPPVGSLVSSKPYEVEKKRAEGPGLVEGKKVKVYFKTKTAGSLEALLKNTPEGAAVLGSGVGDLTESDVFMAKAGNATIFLFEARASTSVAKLAQTEGVAIEKFDVIYALIEKLEELINEGIEKISGRAEVVASFPYEERKVAGCRILSGIIKKGDNLKLMRGEALIGKVRALSIRKQKDEVAEVSQGEECGILFSPQLDFAKGDVLLSVAKQG